MEPNLQTRNLRPMGTEKLVKKKIWFILLSATLWYVCSNKSSEK